jgi:hypothetical protein
MKTTPNYGWSWPESGDHTRTWEYWQSLATQVDTTLKGVDVNAAGTIPFCRATRAAACPTFAAGTAWTVAFDTKYDDASGMFNAAGDTITIKKAGLWSLSFQGSWIASADGWRQEAFMLSGIANQFIPALDHPVGIAGRAFRFSFNWTGRLAANQTVQVRVDHGAAAATGLNVTYNPFITCVWTAP